MVMLIVTLNAWWIVKQTGRQEKGMFEAQEASLVDGSVVWPDAASAAKTQTPEGRDE